MRVEARNRLGWDKIEPQPIISKGAHVSATRVIFSALICFSTSIASASDWRYGGYNKTKDVETILFYDADSLVRHGSTVRFWFKAIKTKDLDRFSKKHKEYIETCARKLADGYVPKYLTLPAIKKAYATEKAYRDAIAQAILYEACADASGIPTDITILWEIDYKTLMSKALSVRAKEKLSASTQNPHWDYITRDTTMDWLSQILDK